MKHRLTLFSLLFLLMLSFPAKAYYGVYYSFSANKFYFWPGVNWVTLQNTFSPKPYHMKTVDAGSYLLWKKNNAYFNDMAEQKMQAYVASQKNQQYTTPMPPHNADFRSTPTITGPQTDGAKY